MTQQTNIVLSDNDVPIIGGAKMKVKYMKLQSGIMITVTDDRENYIYDCLIETNTSVEERNLE